MLPLSFLFPTVPGPIDALSVDSMVITLSVSWEEPGMPNGVITGYKVRYGEVGEAQDKEESTAETSTELTGLKPNTTYSISVLAINGAGDGNVTDIQGTTDVTRK